MNRGKYTSIQALRWIWTSCFLLNLVGVLSYIVLCCYIQILSPELDLHYLESASPSEYLVYVYASNCIFVSRMETGKHGFK